MNRFKNELLNTALKNYAKERNSETTNSLIYALLNGVVMVPCNWDKEPVDQENGEMAFPADTQFSLLTIETKDHQRLFPMFSSTDEWEKWEMAPKAKSLALSFEQYIDWVEMAKNEVYGIVLDPYGANVPFPSSTLLELKNIPRNLEEKKIGKGVKVSLREPVQNIEDLKETFIQFAKEHPSIKMMTIKERFIEGKPSHWFLIVDMDPENPELFEEMGESARNVNHGKEFEFIFASMKLSKNILKDSTPFYEK